MYRQKLTDLLTIIRERCAGQLTAAPDAETRYLTGLIASLEPRRGVLAYVELAAETQLPERPTLRPEAAVVDAWGLDSAFTLLERPATDSPATQGQKPVKTRLDSIRAALDAHAHFVLIGEPGAGKTTTIQRLALDAARQRLRDPRGSPLPFLAYLSAWHDELNVAEFIRSQWRSAGLPDMDPMQVMATSDVTVYLDGLNEMVSVGPDRARQLRDWIDSRQPPRRVIVTCRAGDYAGDLDLRLPVVLAGL